jgi:hypothetical protein
LFIPQTTEEVKEETKARLARKEKERAKERAKAKEERAIASITMVSFEVPYSVAR